MSGNNNVSRQYKEIRSYNLFYSIMTGRATPCIKEEGWVIVRYFARFPDRYSGVTVEPDFILYNGRVCWFVELKSGNNINDRDIRQMSEYNDLTIDGVEEELRDSDIQEETPYDGTVDGIETSIIYQDINEDWIYQCRNVWENCRDSLERLEAETALLTQQHGGKLEKLGGEFETNTVEQLLTDGINLPENPKEEIVLTEQMEKETLAIAICDIWGEQAYDYEDPVEVNVNQIRDFFSPRFNIQPQRVNRVLYYLHVINACTHVDGLNYEFSEGNIKNIIGIKNLVRNDAVDSTLSDVPDNSIPDAGQRTLDESIPDSESVADGGEDEGEENG